MLGDDGSHFVLGEAGDHLAQIVVLITDPFDIVVDVAPAAREVAGEDIPRIKVDERDPRIISIGDQARVLAAIPEIDRGIFLALAKLGLAAEDCVAIEDSRNGLLSAHQAGIATVITPSIYTDDQNFDEAVLVATNLGDVDFLSLYAAFAETSQ